MTATYATREQVRDQAKAAASDTSEDSRVDEARIWATAMIDEAKDYEWFPRKKTYHIRIDDSRYFDRWQGLLYLPTPLLEVGTITEADGSALTEWDGVRATYDDADFLPEPFNETPYITLQRLNGGNVIGWGGSGGNIVTLEDCFWGFHRDWANAWTVSGDSLKAAYTAGAGQITVNDADGANAYQYSPRFSPGNLLKIGAVYFAVLGVNTTTNVLTVDAGARGTTDASLDLGTAIYTFQPERPIERACARLALFYLKHYGQFSNFVVNSLEGTKTAFPDEFPTDVNAALARYPELRRMRGI
jgi:hypothetical protein